MVADLTRRQPFAGNNCYHSDVDHGDDGDHGDHGDDEDDEDDHEDNYIDADGSSVIHGREINLACE